MTAVATFNGLPVVPDDQLPIDPTPGEDARRIVRHGLADVLRWLGEEVGPKPGEVVSCLVVDGRMHVSPVVYRQLRDRVAGYQPRRAPAAPEPEPQPMSAWLRRRMCESKVRHPSREAAVRFAAGHRALRSAPLMRIYECPVCSGFHLTTKPQRRAAS